MSGEAASAVVEAAPKEEEEETAEGAAMPAAAGGGDGGGDAPEGAPAAAAAAVVVEHHGPLAEFLRRLVDEYEPTVPEEVSRYYLQLGGVRLPEAGADEATSRLVALATDHFLATVVQDAHDFGEIRSAGAGGDRCLRSRDVMLALQRQGVTSLSPESVAPTAPKNTAGPDKRTAAAAGKAAAPRGAKRRRPA